MLSKERNLKFVRLREYEPISPVKILNNIQCIIFRSPLYIVYIINVQVKGINTLQSQHSMDLVQSYSIYTTRSLFSRRSWHNKIEGPNYLLPVGQVLGVFLEVSKT
jgi:hypothetical protein